MFNSIQDTAILISQNFTQINGFGFLFVVLIVFLFLVSLLTISVKRDSAFFSLLFVAATGVCSFYGMSFDYAVIHGLVSISSITF